MRLLFKGNYLERELLDWHFNTCFMVGPRAVDFKTKCLNVVFILFHQKICGLHKLNSFSPNKRTIDQPVFLDFNTDCESQVEHFATNMFLIKSSKQSSLLLNCIKRASTVALEDMVKWIEVRLAFLSHPGSIPAIPKHFNSSRNYPTHDNCIVSRFQNRS